MTVVIVAVNVVVVVYQVELFLGSWVPFSFNREAMCPPFGVYTRRALSIPCAVLSLWRLVLSCFRRRCRRRRYNQLSFPGILMMIGGRGGSGGIVVVVVWLWFPST